MGRVLQFFMWSVDRADSAATAAHSNVRYNLQRLVESGRSGGNVICLATIPQYSRKRGRVRR